jgi:hypothetical protein
MVEPLARTVDYFNSRGVTSAHDAGLGWSDSPAFIIDAYQRLRDAGRLNARVYLSILDPFYRPLKDLGLKTGFGGHDLKLGSVKLFQDGSIQIHTAALNQPYFDRPDRRGALIHPQETLDRLAAEFHAAGCQLAIHCNGDAAISSVLDALEKAQQKHPRSDPRHLLIHCQMADETHLDRMKAVGAMPSFFVNHVHYWGDDHLDRFLGPDRAHLVSPLAAAVRRNLPFTLHSDMPVTPVDPLFAIHCAVNRTTRAGRILGPDLKIDGLTALKAYTTWGALASFEEDQKGAIQPGHLADFVVLSGDPAAAPPEVIGDIEVKATFVGGRLVWGSL